MTALLTIIALVFMVAAIMWAYVLRTPMRHFELYKHHGEAPVWVRSDLKGKHREHCLCYSCKRFHPGSPGNCPIARGLYENCVTNDLVTPVWECPKFTQNPSA